MGARGPIPNASDDLARDRSRKGKDQVAVTKGVRIEPRIWEADPEWSPLAVDLFDSASTSGQMDFYQDTDWVMLKFLCGEITAYENAYKTYTTESGAKRTPVRNGQWLSAILSLATSLLTTEGDRRRVRIELAAAETKKPDFTLIAMDAYRGVADPN